MKIRIAAHTKIQQSAFPMSRQQTSTDAEHLITASGRQCYTSFHRPNPATHDDADYIDRTLLEQGHWSVAEHATVSFRIEGISRNCLAELTRHRQFSYSVISQRFVNSDEAECVIPPLFRGDEWAEDLIRKHMWNSRDLYAALAERATAKHGAARKQAREAARTVLPGGTETSLVMTGNHRSFREMLTKRYSPHADAEIRELATEILRRLRFLAPSIYADFPKTLEV